MKRKLTLEQAVRWCQDNLAQVNFYDTLIEVSVYREKEFVQRRDFKVAVTALARKLERLKSKPIHTVNNT